MSKAGSFAWEWHDLLPASLDVDEILKIWNSLSDELRWIVICGTDLSDRLVGEAGNDILLGSRSTRISGAERQAYGCDLEAVIAAGCRAGGSLPPNFV